MKAEFEVGNSGKYLIEVYCSTFTGLEIYSVNSKKVLKYRSYKLNDIVGLSCGDNERYKIKIILETFSIPLSKIYVNGSFISHHYLECYYFSSNEAIKKNKLYFSKWEKKISKRMWRHLLIRGFLLGILISLGQSLWMSYNFGDDVNIFDMVILNFIIWPILFVIIALHDWRTNIRKYEGSSYFVNRGDNIG